MKTIKIKKLGIEIEKELHKEMENVGNIKIPKGWRLLTLNEFLEIWNNYKNKFDFGGDKFDEILEQPLKEKKKEYPFYNVWFYGLDLRSGLYGSSRDLDCSSWSRGVRFCRSLK